MLWKEHSAESADVSGLLEDFSYVYTRRGVTSTIDATAWGRGVKYHSAVYIRQDVAMI